MLVGWNCSVCFCFASEIHLAVFGDLICAFEKNSNILNGSVHLKDTSKILNFCPSGQCSIARMQCASIIFASFRVAAVSNGNLLV